MLSGNKTYHCPPLVILAESQPWLSFKCNESLRIKWIPIGQTTRKLFPHPGSPLRHTALTSSVLALTLSRYYLRERTYNAVYEIVKEHRG
jgi:hypothetical protein